MRSLCSIRPRQSAKPLSGAWRRAEFDGSRDVVRVTRGIDSGCVESTTPAGRGSSDYCVALLLILGGAHDAFAQSGARVLVFHGPPDATIDAGRRRDRGARDRERLRGRRDRRTRRNFTAANLAQLPRRGLPQQRGRPASTPRRRPPCRATSRAAAASSASARAAEAEPAQHVRHRPDRRAARRRRARPRPRDQVVVFGDRAHPSTPQPAAGVDAQRRLLPLDHAPDGHGPYRRALPRDLNAPAGDGTHHGRHRLADLLVPRLSRAGAPSTPAWAAPPPPTASRSEAAPARRDPVVRGPRPRRLQGHDPDQLLDRRVINAAKRQPRTAASRTASPPASNGWMFYIGRADCRTDAQRGKMIGQAS